MSILNHFLLSPLIKIIDGYLDIDVEFLCNAGMFIYGRLNTYGTLCLSKGDSSNTIKKSAATGFQKVILKYDTNDKKDKGDKIKVFIMYMINCNWYKQINYLIMLYPELLSKNISVYIKHSIECFRAECVEYKELFDENSGLYTSLNTFKNIVDKLELVGQDILFTEILKHATDYNIRALSNILQWKVFSNDRHAGMLMSRIMSLTGKKCELVFRVMYEMYDNLQGIKDSIEYYIDIAYETKSYDILRQMARYNMIAPENILFMDETTRIELSTICEKSNNSVLYNWSA